MTSPAASPHTCTLATSRCTTCLPAWRPTSAGTPATWVHLNNKYAVDGRDPNSYAGIFWCFGRYDRPWPERPVFGKIRCMTSQSTVKKLRLRKYLLSYS